LKTSIIPSDQKTDKQEYRGAQTKISLLWNGFDPIGVVESDVTDEYEMYVWPTFSLFKKETDDKTLIQFVEYIVYERMGLTPSQRSKANIRKFANNLKRIPIDI
jgi:hypothetical protein